MRGNNPEMAAFGSTIGHENETAPTSETVRFTPALVCYAGAQRGQTYPIGKLETIIGRGASPGFSITDKLASRIHLRLFYKNWSQPSSRPECYLEDAGSRNGTTVNGQPLKGRHRLSEHDRVQIGTTVLGYVVKDEQELSLNNSLLTKATKDALTTLDNRSQFELQLRMHLEEARRAPRHLAILIIDADKFKLVNDTYGHDVGDKVLVHLAEQIRECFRNNEICARWGGEEFVVLLPNCTLGGALAAAERIRSAVETAPVEIGMDVLHLSVSVGGAVMAPGESAQSGFRRADQQLLQAKSSGRNQTKVVGPVGGDNPTGYQVVI